MRSIVVGASLAAVFVFLQAVPLAEAQYESVVGYGVSFEVGGYEDVVAPITETREVPIVVIVECAGAETRLEARTLDLSVEADQPWAVPIVVPPQLSFTFTAQQCVEKETQRFDVMVTTQVTASAPAFAPTKITLNAVQDAGSRDPVDFRLRAGFYERWQARFDENMATGEPWSEVVLPLTIENYGNGPITIEFRTNERSSKMLTSALPGLQVVPSTIHGAETNRLTVNLQVRLSDDEHRQDQFLIDLLATSTDDPTIWLTPLQVAAIIQTRPAGVDPAEELPVPAFVPLVVSLVAVAAFARRLDE